MKRNGQLADGVLVCRENSRPELQSNAQSSDDALRCHQSATNPKQAAIAWFRECGCTGLAIEAQHMIAPLAALLSARGNHSTDSARQLWLRRRIFTNVCSEGCPGRSPEVAALIDMVAVPEPSFWRRIEDGLRYDFC